MIKKIMKYLLLSVLFPVFFLGLVHADSVKIGFNVPLTGFAAADGKSALNGAKLAVKQANQAGGINGKMIELVVYDDQASPKQAVPISNKLIEKDKVVAAISGSYSGATRAAAGVFQSAEIPYISAYAVHPEITKAGNYVFRTSFMGEVQGRAGAKLIGATLQRKRVVLITLKNDFGKSLAAGFKEAAGQFNLQIVNEYEYSIKDRQFGPIVAKVKADAPEAIYATGYFFTAGPLVSQLRAAGITVPVIGQEGYDSEQFIKIAGKASEGTIITTSLDRDSNSSETRSFISEFEAMAGHKVDMVAASGHTAMKVLVAAMKKAGTTSPSAIRNAIAQTNLVASTGSISFNDLGEVQKNVQVQVVRDGDFHYHSEIRDQVLLAPPTR
ncbi:MAG: ABC transporter substrate-binding protein [SAR324 cluster bacterium]|jgi:branched-chain amino acid transport system substrate-binding protein|nr:ABC transporter substrate-binding protein [SAR324 cluster bacterium]GIR31447.1 MAG: ABC transporter substrate-binding protein [Deltaproteobacteria bacterium]MEC7213790.1 ABC transporter substrate-binding protein [SAR324 cluster bacterium]MEC8185778.1 ABC transporter substrate-binding protein [SAR324 cluster bacterium]MEC8842489.1 ABC transporter substrate-binding protein [SAR324 cluster bacterium]|tara:strand:+ start:230 stop:1381 length:1152 start_codon:yes stop_codon:yes gene_type:complete